MSSKDDVTRTPPSVRLHKEPWPDIQSPNAQALTSIYYHHAIGRIITRWNRAELIFRILVGRVFGLDEEALHALLTHVGSVTLREAASTIAHDIIKDDALKNELQYAARLFDKNRENRNFIAHSSTDIMDMHVSTSRQPGIIAETRKAHGKLTTAHYLLSLTTLRKTADEISDCEEYFRALISPLGAHKKGKPKWLPPRPPLPRLLQKHHPTGDLLDLILPHVRNEGPPR